MVKKYFIKEIVIAILLITGTMISIKQYKNMAKEAVIEKVEESIKEVVKPAEDIKETIEEIIELPDIIVPEDVFIQEKESEESDGR
jgi:hypothetical protein